MAVPGCALGLTRPNLWDCRATLASTQALRAVSGGQLAQRDLAGAAEELSGREAESSGRSLGESKSARQRRRTKRWFVRDFVFPQTDAWTKLTIHDLLFRNAHLIVNETVLLDLVA